MPPSWRCWPRAGRSGVDHPSASRLYLFYPENITYSLVLRSGICAGEGGIYPPDPARRAKPIPPDIIAALETARVSWHLAHGASSLSGVKAAVKAGLGVTARPVEMMSPDLRVAGISEGLPALPDTRYVVSCNPRTVSELPQAIFQSLSQRSIPGKRAQHLPEEGGNTLVL